MEVALIHDVVTEHKIGNMRIQFWRDLLENVYKVDMFAMVMFM